MNAPQEQTTTPQPAPGAAVLQTPPAQPAVEPSRVYGSSTGLITPTATPEVTLQTPPAAPTPPAADGESDESVTDAAGNVLRGASLTARLERERRKFLRDEYGTDDPKKIEELKAGRARAAEDAKKRDAEYARLKKEEDARKRDAMTEQQRLQSDLEGLRKENAALKAQVREFESTRVSTEQEAIIRGVAVKHIDDDLMEDAVIRFAMHARQLAKEKPRELARMTDRDIDRWFKQLAKDRPKFARVVAPTDAEADRAPAAVTPTPEPVRPRRQVIRTAPAGKPTRTDPTARTASPAATETKTARPGQPNSMTSNEVRQELKKRGLSGW